MEWDVMNLYLVNRYILFKYAISKNNKDTLKIDYGKLHDVS